MLGDARVEDELIDTVPIATVPIARVEDELIALGHGCERVGDAHKRIEVKDPRGRLQERCSRRRRRRHSRRCKRWGTNWTHGRTLRNIHNAERSGGSLLRGGEQECAKEEGGGGKKARSDPPS